MIYWNYGIIWLFYCQLIHKNIVVKSGIYGIFQNPDKKSFCFSFLSIREWKIQWF